VEGVARAWSAEAVADTAPPRRGEVGAGGGLDTQPLLSPEQVATMCGLSRRAVYRAIERGELIASRVCSRLRIRPEDVADWLDRNRVEPATARSHRPPQPPPPPRARGSLRSMLSAGEGTR
jgi:excisionase family DNA binding protein